MGKGKNASYKDVLLFHKVFKSSLYKGHKTLGMCGKNFNIFMNYLICKRKKKRGRTFFFQGSKKMAKECVTGCPMTTYQAHATLTFDPYK